MRDLLDDNFTAKTSELIEQKLTDSAILRQLIETRSYTRCLGKTTALINFAKKHNFNVIVTTGSYHLQKEHNYDKIFSVDELGFLEFGDLVVIDENVDREKMIKHGLQIITGFYYRK